MTKIQLLSIGGGLSGSLGSILTAFSVSGSIRELHFARQFLSITTEALAGRGGVPIFEGLDTRFAKAAKRDGWLLWIGVLLLIAGFGLQAASSYLAP